MTLASSQKLLAFVKGFVSYVLVPTVTWTMAALCASDAQHTALSGRDGNLYTALALLVVLSVYTYQTGYQGAYKGGRKIYFSVVFVAPTTVALIGTLIGMVGLFDY